MPVSRSRDNIFVTGFSGTGKTTAGREAARLLGWRFVDTDDEIGRHSIAKFSVPGIGNQEAENKEYN